MNLYVAICLLAVAASANADGALGLGGLGGLDGLVYAPGHASADYYAYPRYAFEYSVKDPHTGDNKAQWEKRDGDVVKGAYSLVEPDGSLRVVEYWADDKSGFNAVVKRLGPNLHPTTVHAAPIYKAPIPVLGHGPVVSPISIGSVASLGHLASAPLISGPIHGPALSTQNLIKEAVPIVKTVVPTPILPAPILPAPIHHAPYYGRGVLPNEPVPILKSILPVPLVREPIGHAPLLQAPILPGPIYKSGPIYSKPLGPLPIYKEPLPLYKGELPLYKGELPLYNEALPLYKEPLPLYKGPLPLYKEALPLYKEPLPLYKEALPLPLLKGPVEVGPVGDWQVIGKGPIAPWGGLGKGPYGSEGLGKGPLFGDLGYGKGIGALGHLNPVSLGGHGLVKGPIEPLPYEIIEKAPHVPAWNGPLESYPLYPGGYKH